MNATAIRDAATLIVLRRGPKGAAVLMGQRGARAAFMPGKFVFPGGAVDPGDGAVPLAAPPPMPCAARLTQDSSQSATALVAAAIRELWEETGQILGRPGSWNAPPADWARFAATGHLPDPSGLRFVFRAVTPPGLTRRFDARFFLVDAARLASDPDDFGAATDELGALQWVPLALARGFDLPFITQVVLAEVMAQADSDTPPASVPHFRNDDEAHLVARLGAQSPLARG